MTRDEATRVDRLLGGRLILRQPVHGHRAGTDAVLLAAAAPRGARRVADLGGGVGAVGLAVALRESGVGVVLVEISPELARLAAENTDANGLSARCRVVVADLLAPGQVRRAAGLAPRSVDLVVTNPPYSAAGTGSASPDPARARAHVMPRGGLEKWLRAASDILVADGEIVVIHRPDGLMPLLSAMAGRFGAVVVKAAHPRRGAAASRLLVRARKGSRAPLSLAAPLILHGDDGAFTAEVEAIHRGEADIAW